MKRTLTARQRILLAKLVFMAGGYAYRYLKWRRPFYSRVPGQARSGKAKPAGHSWRGPTWALRFALKASRIDKEHFEHWGFNHDHCDSVQCDVCKGLVCLECGAEDDYDEEEQPDG